MFEDFEPKLEVMFSSLSVNLSRPSKCGLDGEWDCWDIDRSDNPLLDPVDMLLGEGLPRIFQKIFKNIFKIFFLIFFIPRTCMRSGADSYQNLEYFGDSSRVSGRRHPAWAHAFRKATIRV